MNPEIKFKYRKDVDGLRALAIIPVVLYHIGIFGFSGGYVGVDIFFVISGYLITSIILKDLVKGQFSFWHFYERRVRRLLPALIVMMSVTAFLSYFFLTYNEDFKLFGGSLFAQSLSLVNFFLLRNSDYFAAPSDGYPLLHTWSLSVEEQFYLVFPALLFILFLYFQKHKGLILTLLGLISFTLCIYFTNLEPLNQINIPFLAEAFRNANNVTVAFYLLPTRMWELIIGALIAVFALEIKNKKLSEIASIVGLLLILFSVFFFSSVTLFPGYSALLPTIGAALIIVSGVTQTPFVNKLLSIQPIVWIGLISYSLYLWHWPIIVFAKVVIFEPTIMHHFALIVLSAVIALLSYYFIEQPFRRSDRNTSQRTVMAGLLILFLLASLGYAIKSERITNSFSSQYTEKLLNAQDVSYLKRSCLDNPYESKCDSGGGNGTEYQFILWGDSHAEMYYPVISELAKKNNLQGKYFTLNGCEPIVEVYTKPRNPRCENLKQQAFEFIEDHQIKNVIIVARWDLYVNGISSINKRNVVFSKDSTGYNRKNAVNALQTHLIDTLKELHSNGVQVTIFRQIPFRPDFEPRDIYYKSIANGDLIEMPILTKEEHLHHQKFMDEVIEAAEVMGMAIVDPTTVICPDNFCILTKNGEFLYKDTNHLTLFGAKTVEPIIIENIDFANFKKN